MAPGYCTICGSTEHDFGGCELDQAYSDMVDVNAFIPMPNELKQRIKALLAAQDTASKKKLLSDILLAWSGEMPFEMADSLRSQLATLTTKQEKQ